jgi:hypothetical protein
MLLKPDEALLGGFFSVLLRAAQRGLGHATHRLQDPIRNRCPANKEAGERGRTRGAF